MENAHVLDIFREALKVGILLAGPLLIFALVVGVLTNMFQAVTQISEATLAFVPKMLAMMLAFVLFSPWMIDIITNFTAELFGNIPAIIR